MRDKSNTKIVTIYNLSDIIFLQNKDGSKCEK